MSEQPALKLSLTVTLDVKFCEQDFEGANKTWEEWKSLITGNKKEAIETFLGNLDYDGMDNIIAEVIDAGGELKLTEGTYDDKTRRWKFE